MKITFETTPNGKHIINLDQHGRLVFSDITKTPQGYRWMAYSKSYVERIEMKNSDGSRDYREVDQRESHVFTFKLKRDTEGKLGIPNGTIPRKIAKKLVSIFDEFVDGEVLPYKNIENLKSKIEKTNFNKILPKKRKKKLTKKEKAAQEKSLAILRRSVDEENNRS
jgi:hypothetical protein